MKQFITAIIIATLLLSCGGGLTTTESQPTSTIDTIQVSIEPLPQDSIDSIMQRLLAVPDTAIDYGFLEIEVGDANSRWLLNRIAQMKSETSTTNDNWAWMLAVNKVIDQYSSRIGRKMDLWDLRENAIADIEQIAYDMPAGTQREINMSSSILSMITKYRSAKLYLQIIESINDTELKQLIHKEFNAWHNINNTLSVILHDYTFSAAHYSSAPMDMSEISEKWYAAKLAEIFTDDNIIRNGDTLTSDSTEVDSISLAELNTYFKERINFNNHDNLAAAIKQWRDTRNLIASKLPQAQQNSYREATKQTLSRIYNDALDLQQTRY